MQRYAQFVIVANCPAIIFDAWCIYAKRVTKKQISTLRLASKSSFTLSKLTH